MVVKTTYVFEAIDNISATARQMSDSLQKIGDSARKVSEPIKEESGSISDLKSRFNDLFASLNVEAPKTLEQQATDLKTLLSTSNEIPKTVEEIERMQTALKEISAGGPDELMKSLKMSSQEVSSIIKKLDEAKKRAKVVQEQSSLGNRLRAGAANIKQSASKVGQSMVFGNIGGIIDGLKGLSTTAKMLGLAFGAVIAAISLFTGALNSARERTRKYVETSQTLREGWQINRGDHRERERYERDLPVIKVVMTIGNILEEWFAIVNDVMINIFGGIESTANILETVKEFIIQILAVVGAGIVFIRSMVENAMYFYEHMDELLPKIPEMTVALIQVIIYTAIGWVVSGLQMIAESLSWIGGGGLAEALGGIQASIQAQIEANQATLGEFFQGFRNPMDDAMAAYQQMLDAMHGIQYDDHKIMIQGERTLYSLEGFVDIARSSMYKTGGESGKGIADINAWRREANIINPNDPVGTYNQSQNPGGTQQGSQPKGNGQGGISGSDYAIPSGGKDSDKSQNVTNNQTMNNTVTVNIKLDALGDSQLTRLGTIILNAITTEMNRNAGTAKQTGL
jgi:hypothetical protein